ncbi:MAG TPA: flagellar basal body-associated FliL family protein [Acidimicrobiia bacterium]|jgi:flagellar FliL protein|nr:flagellar basal body-associated FliL family protein [Acidimicrobiia bacterium]
MAKKKAAAEGEEAKGGKGKTIAMGAVLAIGLLGGLKGFVLSGGAKAAAATGVSTTTTTKPGPVVTLDPITVNIASDRFLKIGLGIQLSGKLAGVARPHDADDPTKGFARALDLTIETFGGHTYESLVKPEGRAAAKEELVKKLEAAYPEEVEGVYFTDFVMQ